MSILFTKVTPVDREKFRKKLETALDISPKAFVAQTKYEINRMFCEAHTRKAQKYLAKMDENKKTVDTEFKKFMVNKINTAVQQATNLIK